MSKPLASSSAGAAGRRDGHRHRRARHGPARLRRTRVHDLLHSNATLGPLFVLLLAVVIFSLTADRFLAAGRTSR